ncbi:MAG: hypothetical protein ACKO6L_05100 [Flavobacteriales bacterium]
MNHPHPHQHRINHLPKGTFIGEWTKEKIEYVLLEMVEENQLASRALYSILDIQLTQHVRTLAVSLSAKPTLMINLDFCNQHVICENDMKCVIMHEFLHILLGHTIKIEKNTPLTNIAMDAIINALIHRKFGSEYSQFFVDFYKNSQYCPLLQPYLHLDDIWFTDSDSPELDAELNVAALHKKIYSGAYSSDEVLEILEYYAPYLLNIPNDILLIGNHGEFVEGDGEEKISKENQDIIERIVVEVGGIKDLMVFEAPDTPTGMSPERAMQNRNILKWKRGVYPILMRCLSKDSNKMREKFGYEASFPILSTQDRRATSKFLYSGLLPISSHTISHTLRDQSTSVYLDVSGSMNDEISALVNLILQLRQHVAWPLWSFSNEVYPAKMERNAIQFNTTTGTSIGCVFDHMRKEKTSSAVIITDGYIEEIKPFMLRGINLKELNIIVTSSGSCQPFKDRKIQHYQLPKLEK